MSPRSMSFACSRHTVVFGSNAAGFPARLITRVELSAAVGRRTAIVVGYRYFGAPDGNVAVRPTRVLNEQAGSCRELRNTIATSPVFSGGICLALEGTKRRCSDIVGNCEECHEYEDMLGVVQSGK
jgi:hypothetical protein